MSSFRGPMTLRRRTAGTLVDGVWTDGTPQADVTIYASKQPLTAREVLLLPEGMRLLSSYKLFGDTELRPANAVQGVGADIIVLPDGNYEVISSKPWQNNVINHYNSVIVKVVS